MNSAGSEVVAQLGWEAPAGQAIGKAAEGVWVFMRGSSIRTRVCVREAGQESDLATLLYGCRDEYKLEFCGGRLFWWRRDWSSRAWAFFSEDGRWLLRCSLQPGFWAHKGCVEVERHAGALPEISLLALLGWYELVMAHEADAANAAMAALAQTVDWA